MNINEMFPSKYLKGTDMVNRIVNVIIEGVTFTDEFDEGRKYVLSFQGAKKSLMLNKTNVGILQWLFPDVSDTNGWVGKEIQLYTELVSFKGQTGPAVRIRGTKSVLGQGAVQVGTSTADPLDSPATAQPGDGHPMGPGEQAAAKAEQVQQPAGQPVTPVPASQPVSPVPAGQPKPGDPADLHDDVMSDPIPF